MILLIDNYDSFVYNLARYVRELGETPLVRRHDAITPEEILALTFTDKAATEMETRVDKLVPYGYVGAMLSTLFLTRYLMPVLYSFYGHREPPANASNVGH